ncbi:MAG: class I SAM-dependent methyltransferase [Thermomicrobiales bacterium]
MSNDADSVKYLRDEQYADDANLASRIAIHRLYSSNPQGWFPWVFDHLGLADGTNVLELGCGDGRLWSENLNRVPTGVHLVLTDFSAGMVEATRSRLSARLSNARYQVADAQAIPFEDATFDVVVANHMLYHVPNLEQALLEIRRVLKPDGRFYASTNGSRHMVEIEHLVRVRAPAAQTQNPTRFFDLDNGPNALSRVFGHVKRDNYVDSLEVTDSLDVIRYLLSTPAKAFLTEERIRDLRRALDNQILLAGAFHVSKETGLFTCNGRA